MAGQDRQKQKTCTQEDWRQEKTERRHLTTGDQRETYELRICRSQAIREGEQKDQQNRRYIDRSRNGRTGQAETEAMYLRILATREGGAYGKQTETQKPATHAGGRTQIKGSEKERKK